ncbi:hypothetical protein CVP04_10810 [Caviibacterium pharyngocola]|uniref:Uncharacterized protein n=1 Tax=Caviibacterium pharyngocola TaxID=28159 RepID=A0A2M8RTC3_9PAST|nr:hypothetical protein CVP04_10810 [Caviibacterium pharyngocola]
MKTVTINQLLSSIEHYYLMQKIYCNLKFLSIFIPQLISIFISNVNLTYIKIMLIVLAFMGFFIFAYLERKERRKLEKLLSVRSKSP